MTANANQNKTLDAILADPKLRAEWIKYQLRIRGQSLAQIARDAGCNRNTVTSVWTRRYPAMQRRIADALGMSPEILFPERYSTKSAPSGKGRRSGRGASKK
jgi:Ner family transcriptional regulator